MLKNKKLIGLLIVLIAMWGGYKFVLAKPLSRIGELRQEMKLVQRELSAYETSGAPPSPLGAKPDGAATESVPPSLLSEQDVPFVLERFFKEVSGHNDIHFKLIQPGLVETEGKYRKLPITMRFNGTFDDVGTLLDRIEHLSLVARTDLIEIREGSTPGSINGHVVASVLLMPGPPIVVPVTGTPSAAPLSWMEVSDPFDRFDLQGLKKSVRLMGAPEPVELELSGIWFGSKPRAVINNTVVGEGMSVDGYRVQKIYANKVVVSRNGQQRTLTVRGGESDE